MKRKTMTPARSQKLTVWEESLFQTVLSALADGSSRPVVRFNFLVHAGRVYFLDQPGWWHCVPGEANKVAQKLRRKGIPTIVAKVAASKAAWIPYFGRKHDEEPNRGWNDGSLRALALQPRHQVQLDDALATHRAYLQAPFHGRAARTAS